MIKIKAFEKDIAAVINNHGLDTLCDMQDFVLAEYVTTCLTSLKEANEKKKSLENNEQKITEWVKLSEKFDYPPQGSIIEVIYDGGSKQICKPEDANWNMVNQFRIIDPIKRINELEQQLEKAKNEI